MREIKFRAWDKATEEHWKPKKEMIYFDIYNVPKFIGNTYTEPNSDKFVRRFEVMQYTGLKDKNGVEIYEGDIVTGWFNNQKIVGQIFYGSNAGFFIQRKDLLCISLINSDVWVEVIGNIYENPELLLSA